MVRNGQLLAKTMLDYDLADFVTISHTHIYMDVQYNGKTELTYTERVCLTTVTCYFVCNKWQKAVA